MFGAHDIIRAAIRFASYDSDFGHCRFGEGVQELGAVPDDPAVFLSHTGQEARDIHKRDDREVEAVAEADKARGLDAGIDVKYSGE